MVSIGRSRLPPESIRWCARVGISSTSDTALSRMMRLTACISSATISIKGLMPSAGSRASSNGTTTPKLCYPPWSSVALGIAGTDEGSSPIGATQPPIQPARERPRERLSGSRMHELLRSNDAVLISFAESILREAGVGSLVADQHMSVIEGSIGAFPRRLLVKTEDAATARQALSEAGLDAWLVRDGSADT